MNKKISMLASSIIISTTMISPAYGITNNGIITKLEEIIDQLDILPTTEEEVDYIQEISNKTHNLPQNIQTIITQSIEHVTQQKQLWQKQRIFLNLKRQLNQKVKELQRNNRWLPRMSKEQWFTTGAITSLATVVVASYFFFPQIQNILTTVKDIVQTPNLYAMLLTAKDVVSGLSTKNIEKVVEVLSPASPFYDAVSKISNLKEAASNVFTKPSSMFGPISDTIFSKARFP